MAEYINDDFKVTMKQWIHLDEQLKQLSQQSKELREEKDILKLKLTSYIQDHQLTDTKFQLPNGYIKYVQQKHHSPLNYNFLHSCLVQYFDDSDLAKNVCDFIKTQRTTTNIPYIRRYLRKSAS
tara:strand:+ start:232 stop:603 length:372 start_codon:yes stop_codon:yes gene_type:complete